jgi:hypothetical protein
MATLTGHGLDSVTSVVVTHARFDVGSILHEFEVQRRELVRRNSGTAGAFTGFTQLDTRPRVLLDIPDGSTIVITTTLCKTSDRQSTLELVAHQQDDPTSALVRGVGVSIHSPDRP